MCQGVTDSIVMELISGTCSVTFYLFLEWDVGCSCLLITHFPERKPNEAKEIIRQIWIWSPLIAFLALYLSGHISLRLPLKSHSAVSFQYFHCSRCVHVRTIAMFVWVADASLDKGVSVQK